MSNALEIFKNDASRMYNHFVREFPQRAWDFLRTVNTVALIVSAILSCLSFGVLVGWIMLSLLGNNTTILPFPLPYMLMPMGILVSNVIFRRYFKSVWETFHWKILG